jgi:hypothetical protein
MRLFLRAPVYTTTDALRWRRGTQAFKRGMDAHNNPEFYRQLGKDPA